MSTASDIIGRIGADRGQCVPRRRKPPSRRSPNKPDVDLRGLPVQIALQVSAGGPDLPDGSPVASGEMRYWSGVIISHGRERALVLVAPTPDDPSNTLNVRLKSLYVRADLIANADHSSAWTKDRIKRWWKSPADAVAGWEQPDG